MPKIVYLDQNKWVALSCAVKAPDEHPELYSVLECCVEKARAGDAIFPLTQTTIYETHKINDPGRRHDVAFTQASLSQGLVFRGRYKRLEVEITNLIHSTYGMPPRPREDNWFLSNVFFESTCEWNDPRLGNQVSERVVDVIKSDPPRYLYKFLMEGPEESRRMAVKNFSEGARKLCAQIEERRTRNAEESLSTRRKIHSASLLINELDLLNHLAGECGVPGQTQSQILETVGRNLVNDCPTYFIEREIALRLEAPTNKPAIENDLRDMQAFCAVIAYADIVIAENKFTNLALQAGLGKKYSTSLSTDLLTLPTLF